MSYVSGQTDRQTDRHTDTLIAILRTPLPGEKVKSGVNDRRRRVGGTGVAREGYTEEKDERISIKIPYECIHSQSDYRSQKNPGLHEKI